MAKRVSARSVKAHRQYTYQEAAETVGVTVQTIRTWRAKGLPVLTDAIQHLILGHALKDFITRRALNTKCPLEDREVYCLRCKRPRKPFGMMADYVPTTDRAGRLVTLCEVCEGRCVRMVKKADIRRMSLELEIALSTRTNA